MDIVNGGYRKQAGVRCQYLGVLAKTMVVGWRRGGSKTQEVIFDAIEKDGGWKGRGEELDRGAWRGIVEWGSEKKRWGGIEGNKLSWVIRRVV